MSRARSTERDKAKELWINSNKTRLLKDIAAELGVPENRVRKWKSEDKWDKGTLQFEKELKRSAPFDDNTPKKRGAQLGNKNSRKHGLYERLYWDSLDEEEIAVIASGGLSFTHPLLAKDDIVAFTYFTASVGLIGENVFNYVNVNDTVRDSVTGKYYRKVTTLANMVESSSWVEVV